MQVQTASHVYSPNDKLELIASLRTAVEPAFTVTGYRFEDGGRIILSGRLKLSPDLAYRPLRAGLERVGYTPLLREAEPASGGATHEVVAVPGVIPRSQQNPFIPLALFVATIASVVMSGSLTGGPDAGVRLDLGNGLMFGVSLLGILTVHEAGHYIVAKLRGAPVSLPYFIPLPLISFVGTLGAVIVQREPFENRKTLLEIAIAGPMAGFVVAVPLLFLGFFLSTAELNAAIPEGATLFGDSLLTLLATALRFGTPDALVNLHPIGFGAWIGLLITGINLLPVGQLDGGHVAYALFGERAKLLSWVIIGAMLIMAVAVSQGWLLWAILLLMFGRSHPPALNQAAKLEPLHYALAVVGVLVLVLTFIPRPVY